MTKQPKRAQPVRNTEQPVVYDQVGGVIVPVTSGSVTFIFLIMAMPVILVLCMIPGALVGALFGEVDLGGYISLGISSVLFFVWLALK